MTVRIMRNGSSIGKPWLLVEGQYARDDLRTMKEQRGRWRTSFQYGEFNTREAAEEAFKDLERRS